MKTLTIFSMVIVLLLAMASCQKDQNINSSQPIETVEPIPEESGEMQLKISSSQILNATSASQIPSFYFMSAWKYRNKYVHIKQYSGECSWTSYVLATAAIINGNLGFYNYPVTHSKITSVKNWCGSSYIERLRDYANQKDYAYFSNVYLCKKYKNSTGRLDMIKQMLYHLYMYQRPFPVIITSNNIGHYVVVWDIDWKQGGSNSYVYYTDPLDNPTTFGNQLKTMSFSTFLDRMGPNNNYVSSYCALFLR